MPAVMYDTRHTSSAKWSEKKEEEGVCLQRPVSRTSANQTAGWWWGWRGGGGEARKSLPVIVRQCGGTPSVCACCCTDTKTQSSGPFSGEQEGRRSYFHFLNNVIL